MYKIKIGHTFLILSLYLFCNPLNSYPEYIAQFFMYSDKGFFKSILSWCKKSIFLVNDTSSNALSKFFKIANPYLI